MLHANFTALCFIEPELLQIEVFIAGMGILDHFCSCDIDPHPMTYIYERPYPLEVYRMCENELAIYLSLFAKSAAI